VRTTNVFFQKKLILDIYLIGYRNKGESIIFVIYTDDIPSYCGVIDCYEYNNLNVTVEILKKKDIKSLDLLCWSHPDEDHSIGIDTIISLYANENTKVLLPGHINGNEYNYNPRIQNTFNIINQNVVSRKVKKYIVRDVCDNMNLVHKNYINKSGQPYEFNICSIAPNSTILRGNDFKETIQKNDYSIGLVLSLGEFKVLFSGDIENRTIERFEDFYLPNFFDCIKVPHHTSESSDRLLNFLNYEAKSEIACTTVFRNHKLPQVMLIDRYKNYVREFYCTGSIETEDTEDYGVIHIQTDIVRKQMCTYLKGNSRRVYSLDCG